MGLRQKNGQFLSFRLCFFNPELDKETVIDGFFTLKTALARVGATKFNRNCDDYLKNVGLRRINVGTVHSKAGGGVKAIWDEGENPQIISILFFIKS